MSSFLQKSLLLSVLLCISVSAQADYQLYGQAHLSTDVVRASGDSKLALGSNATRIGVKGSKKLGAGSLQAVWKIESELDASGEYGALKGRNRYLGVVSSLGTVVGGFQESPYRSLGSKVDLLPDTIADMRSILGSVRDLYDPVTVDTFNLRAKRSVMYVSPRIAGLQVRAMIAFRQFGHYRRDYSSLASEAITSYSAVYKTRFFYVGAAQESHERLERTKVVRFAGGLTLEETDINFIYEIMDSGTDSSMSRDSYGLSLRHRIQDTSLVGQAFFAEDDFWNEGSGGAMYAAGVIQRMSKEFEIYLIGALVDNAALASFRLGAAEHGEYFAPVSGGDNVYGVSLGANYTF